MRFRSWRLIALQRRTNRLPCCGTRADMSSTTWTPGGRASAVVRATSPPLQSSHRVRDPSKVTRVRADLDCLLRHVSPANLGRDGGVACLKGQSSGSLSSNRSSARRAEQRRFARSTGCRHIAANQQNFAARGCARHAVAKQALCEPILSRIPSDDRTTACLTFNICLHRRPPAVPSRSESCMALRQAAPLTRLRKAAIVHRHK